MIYDRLDNLSTYYSVIPQLENIVSMIRKGEVDLNKGAHTTDIEGCRYNTAEYRTTKEDKNFEIHRRDIDVHIALEGTETIRYARRTLTEKEGPYNEEKDFSLVQGASDSDIYMQPGDVAIFFPGEPHKPGIANGEECDVKKVIFKVLF